MIPERESSCGITLSLKDHAVDGCSLRLSIDQTLRGKLTLHLPVLRFVDPVRHAYAWSIIIDRRFILSTDFGRIGLRNPRSLPHRGGGLQDFLNPLGPR